MNFFRDRVTRVIGHRGSPRVAPENTFDSFDAAEAEGVDGFELDLRLTYDGEVIAFHDPDILTGGRRHPVASLTMADIAGIRLPNGERPAAIPTLRDVLLRYGTGARYLLEMKAGPTPRVGLLEHRVAELLARFRVLDQSVVLSYSADMLRRIKELEPAVETCLNFDATTYRPAGTLMPDLPRGCEAIGPYVALATERLFAEAREAGLAVHVWTVNDAEVAARLTSLGAASVITDVPGELGPVIRGITGQPVPMTVAPAS